MRTVLGVACLTAALGLPASAGGNCAKTSVGLTPLTELGTGTYKDEQGGLYPDGQNVPPDAHLEAGKLWAGTIGPLNAGGSADPYGKYAFLSIGMSNTTQEFSRFVQLANADPFKDPHLVVVDGAQGGATADKWADPGNAVWTNADARLTAAGVTPRQVVAAWVKVANANPTNGWTAQADILRTQTAFIVRNLRQRYPGVRVAYISSRIYAGYASTTLNPEPYAYESAFGTKWAIADQINGNPFLNYDPRYGPPWAPWLSWGPYLWADGLNARADGLVWTCADLSNDGTHPSESGREKVARMLLDFVRTDPTARLWYVGEGGINDVPGDANFVNSQGQSAVPLGEWGPGTRPASIDGADLLRVRFETTYDVVVERDDAGQPVRVRHVAKGLRMRTTTYAPASPTFGPTLAFDVAVKVGACETRLRSIVRGPQSAAEDPPEGAALSTLAAACPGGIRSYTSGIGLSFDGPVAMVELPFSATGSVLAAGVTIGAAAGRTAVLPVRQAGATTATGPTIDAAPPADPWVIGQDLPADVDCATQPEHPGCS